MENWDSPRWYPPPRASCVRLTKKIFYQKMWRGGQQSPFVFIVFLVGGKYGYIFKGTNFVEQNLTLKFNLFFFLNVLLKSRFINQGYHKLIIMSQKCLKGAWEHA